MSCWFCSRSLRILCTPSNRSKGRQTPGKKLNFNQLTQQELSKLNIGQRCYCGFAGVELCYLQTLVRLNRMHFPGKPREFCISEDTHTHTHTQRQKHEAEPKRRREMLHIGGFTNQPNLNSHHNVYPLAETMGSAMPYV